MCIYIYIVYVYIYICITLCKGLVSWAKLRVQTLHRGKPHLATLSETCSSCIFFLHYELIKNGLRQKVITPAWTQNSKRYLWAAPWQARACRLQSAASGSSALQRLSAAPWSGTTPCSGTSTQAPKRTQAPLPILEARTPAALAI